MNFIGSISIPPALALNSFIAVNIILPSPKPTSKTKSFLETLAIFNIFLTLFIGVGSQFAPVKTGQNEITTNPNDTKIEILRKIKGRRYEFDKDVCNLILEISDLVKYRKHAPIEFSRKDAFILCDKYYKTVIIKENDMKNYFSKAKVFILQVNNIILEEKKIDEFNR